MRETRGNTDDGEGTRKVRALVQLRVDNPDLGPRMSKADLLHVSATGVRVECDSSTVRNDRLTIVQGDRVTIALPGLEPKPAIVVRTIGRQIACEFLEPFQPFVFQDMIGRLERPRHRRPVAGMRSRRAG